MRPTISLSAWQAKSRYGIQEEDRFLPIQEKTHRVATVG
jgi:hypothetical protein